MFSNGLYIFFSQVSPNQQDRFQPNFHETSETVNNRILSRQNFEFLSVGGRRVEKTPQNTENSVIGVQSFGHNSKTNQDIENRKSSLTSPINSKDNDI